MPPMHPDPYVAMASTLQNANDLIKELSYKSYRYNRERSPDIDPKSWALVFIDAAEFEARYQREKSNARQA